MKKLIGFIAMVMMFGMVNFAVAGPIDWTMEKFGYASKSAIEAAKSSAEVAMAETNTVRAELKGVQREVEIVTNFNQKLSLMIDNANTFAIVSAIGFGAMFMLCLWMSSTIIASGWRKVHDFRETRKAMKAEKKLRSVPPVQNAANG